MDDDRSSWIPVSFPLSSRPVTLANLALLVVLMFGLSGAKAHAQQLEWAAGITPSSRGSSNQGMGVAVDTSGNTHVTGSFRGTATFGAGEPSETSLASEGTTDVFIAKYDPAGALLWARRAGGPDLNDGFGIAVDGSGHSYVTGRFTAPATFGAGQPGETTLASGQGRGIFVAKYDPSGALVWARPVDAAGGFGRDIALDATGHIHVAGEFSGTATFGPGEPNATSLTMVSAGADIFVAKYDPTGALVWARRAGAHSIHVATGIGVDDGGNSYIAGRFPTTAVFGPGEPGETTLLSAGNFDIFLAKYDSTGTLVWARSAGGPELDQATGLAVDGSGNSYVTGSFAGTAIFGAPESGTVMLTSEGDFDVFVAKYDAAGALVWARSASGAGRNNGLGIAIDDDGNSYVTGSFEGTAFFGLGEPNGTSLVSAGNEDVFVAKYDAAGALVWARQAGGSGTDTGRGIAVDGAADLYVTGNVMGFATFGPGEANETVLSSGTFVARYAGEERDDLPPQVTVTVPAPDGLAGWFVTKPVTVTVAATDPSGVSSFSCTVDGSLVTVGNLSGIDTDNASGSIPLADEGVSAIICEATDGAGNSGADAASSNTATVRIDTVAPTIIFDSRTAPNANGWNNTDVEVVWTCSDATSGPLSATVTQTVAAEGADQSATGTCVDMANNSVSDTQGGINIDKTPPAIAIAAPEDGASLVLGQAVTANYSCTDGLSGVVTCEGPVASGAALDASTVGASTFAVTAIDAAGNTATVVHTYGVHYAFAGFFNPVSSDITNIVNSGRVVPLRWQLQDASGNLLLDLDAVANIVYRQVPCVSETVTNPLEGLADDAGASELRIVGTEFQFNWRTERSFANTCMELSVELNDGSAHTARFRFAR